MCTQSGSCVSVRLSMHCIDVCIQPEMTGDEVCCVGDLVG